jgi:hypothetical protein
LKTAPGQGELGLQCSGDYAFETILNCAYPTFLVWLPGNLEQSPRARRYCLNLGSTMSLMLYSMQYKSIKSVQLVDFIGYRSDGFAAG